MPAIYRKLLRDLWAIKGQALAISAVMAVGIIMFIAYLSTFDSLRQTQSSYYDRYRFAHVFANLKRGPQVLEARIAEIPGVAQVMTRVVAEVTLDFPDISEPISARLVSIPDVDSATLNDLAVLEGRYLDAGRSDEVIVSRGFADARQLGVGDALRAVINGRMRTLQIVGLGQSPEFISTLRPGELVADKSRYGILWMERKALASAFDMEGGFNDVSLRLMRGASSDEVIDRLDDLLAPYGGLGAVPRSLQPSHWFIDNELAQLQTFGLVAPMIFLAVATFLLNIVLTRIISVQREQIAALKALGYSDLEIGWHYTLWALSISAVGCVAGILLGRTLGEGMLGIYNQYFDFPFLFFRTPPFVIIGAVGFSLMAAVLGAIKSVRTAVRLPPAEAMRPEPPARYQKTLVERLGLERHLSQPVRMILRNIERQPLRALASICGIAASGGLLIIGLFFMDSIDVLMRLQFEVAQRQDVTVSFVEPRSPSARYELARMPGVLHVEPVRSVPVRLRAGHRQRRTAVSGLIDDPRLQRIVDMEAQVYDLPPAGLLMTTTLAEILEVSPGDAVRLEVLEGHRPVRQAIVAGVVDELMGTSLYMELGQLHALMREGDIMTGAYLQVDAAQAARLHQQLKLTPAVVGVALKQAALDAFRDQMDQMMGVFIFFNIVFASVITIGVVYNAARIALSERSRELASLRVLGFTRGEISFILLGELATLTLIAVPLGLVVGYGFAGLMLASVENEVYRFPLVVSPSTYAISAVVVIGAAILSGLLVRRRLDHLDLVAVLKTTD